MSSVDVEIKFRGMSPSGEVGRLIGSSCGQISESVTGARRWVVELENNPVAPRDRQVQARVSLSARVGGFQGEAYASDPVVACWRAFASLYEQLLLGGNPMHGCRPGSLGMPARALPDEHQSRIA